MNDRQATHSDETLSRYRQTLLDYVRELPLNEVFEEGQISRRTEELGKKVPKMFVREILRGVKGIDQDLLNYGSANGKICRRGPLGTE